MRSGHASLDVCGKPKQGWQVKSLAEIFEVAFNFTHEGHKFTLRKQVDDEGEDTDMPELEIDGTVFSKHQFISEEFSLEDEKSLKFCSGLALNGVEVFAEGECDTWSASMYNQRILKKFGDDPIKAIKIELLRQEANVTNEMLDALMKRNTVESGYSEFEIKDW